MTSTRSLIVAAVLVASAAVARPSLQAPAAADTLQGVRTRAELDALVAKLRAGDVKGAQSLFEKPGGTYRVYTSFIDHRKGLADIHVKDDEVFVVLSGSAQCTLGGDIAARTTDEHGDYHGTTIVGGTTRTVAQGDIVSAPRGTAHQMDPGEGQILYVVIKMLGSR